MEFENKTRDGIEEDEIHRSTQQKSDEIHWFFFGAFDSLGCRFGQPMAAYHRFKAPEDAEVVHVHCEHSDCSERVKNRLSTERTLSTGTLM